MMDEYTKNKVGHMSDKQFDMYLEMIKANNRDRYQMYALISAIWIVIIYIMMR